MDTAAGRKILALVLFLIVGNVLVGVGLTATHGQEGGEGTAARETSKAARNQQADDGADAAGTIAIAMAISIGTACIGGGYAVGRVGSAAIGAASENPEMLTRSLIFVALAEGIAIYGVLVAFLLWLQF